LTHAHLDAVPDGDATVLELGLAFTEQELIDRLFGGYFNPLVAAKLYDAENWDVPRAALDARSLRRLLARGRSTARRAVGRWRRH